MRQSRTPAAHHGRRASAPRLIDSDTGLAGGPAAIVAACTGISIILLAHALFLAFGG